MSVAALIGAGIVPDGEQHLLGQLAAGSPVIAWCREGDERRAAGGAVLLITRQGERVTPVLSIGWAGGGAARVMAPYRGRGHSTLGAPLSPAQLDVLGELCGLVLRGSAGEADVMTPDGWRPLAGGVFLSPDGRMDDEASRAAVSSATARMMRVTPARPARREPTSAEIDAGERRARAARTLAKWPALWGREAS